MASKSRPRVRVPADVLQPKTTWSDGEAYDATADKLASMFNENFKRYEAAFPLTSTLLRLLRWRETVQETTNHRDVLRSLSSSASSA